MAFQVDPSYLYNAMMAESSGNPNAQANTTSAGGLYGFTNPTFLQNSRSFFPAGTSDADILAQKRDPGLQTRAMTALTQANAGVLSSANIPTTNPNLYAAHFLGAGDAKDVLTAPDADQASDYIDDESVRKNPFLKGMTVGQFKQWSAKKIGQLGSGPDPDVPAAGAQATQGQLPPGMAGLMDGPPQQQQQQQQGGSLGNSLMGIGALMMSRGNPVGAQTLETMMNAQRAQQKVASGWKYQGTTDSGKNYLWTNDQGQTYKKPVDSSDQTPDKPAEPKTGDYKSFQANSDVMDNNARTSEAADAIRQNIANGKTSVEWDKRAKGIVLNTAGMSTQESVDIKNAEAVINQQIKNILSQEKGPATTAKMKQALLQIVPSGGSYDNVTFMDAMNRIVDEGQSIYKNAANTNMALLKRYPGLAGGLPGPDGNPLDSEGMRQSYSDRVKNWQEANKAWTPNYEKFKADHFARAKQPNGGGPQGPAVGAVVKGYKFKGGDPTDQNSWEQVQ